MTLQAEKTPSETMARCTGKINSGTAGLLKATATLMLETRTLVLDLGMSATWTAQAWGPRGSLYFLPAEQLQAKAPQPESPPQGAVASTRLNQLFEGQKPVRRPGGGRLIERGRPPGPNQVHAEEHAHRQHDDDEGFPTVDHHDGRRQNFLRRRMRTRCR